LLAGKIGIDLVEPGSYPVSCSMQGNDLTKIKCTRIVFESSHARVPSTKGKREKERIVNWSKSFCQLGSNPRLSSSRRD